MLHLLRLIRKDLIQVNNVKKYSFYAIGEILLLVIGILIAVQIGNWNERRIERVEEREVLARISDEVTRHAEIISLIRSSALPDAQKALEYVTSVFNGAPIAEDSDFLNAVVRSGAFGYSTPRLPITTYEELVNSGKLQLIETVDLRERISAYYLKNDDTERRGDAV